MIAANRFLWYSQWAEAAKAYQRALAEFPDDVAGRIGLGFCYMQIKQWQPALHEYVYILRRDSSNVIALSKTAELYIILNRRVDAYLTYLHLAQVYSRAGQGPNAEATWQKAAQLSPGNPEPHEHLASYYFGKKDFVSMTMELLAAARCYLLRIYKVTASAQCKEVLRVQALKLISQLKGQPQSTNQLAPFATNTTKGGVIPIPRGRIIASQVTRVLSQAQTYHIQGRFYDAINLCEQILASGFDQPDTRYFLGQLYQEQQRWVYAIRQFQMLLNDPDYALSCFYAIGQCYRARGDLKTASVHFDEAVDRVNLDALTAEEFDQLVQLCQEAAETHLLLGEKDIALIIYNEVRGFFRSRGWNDRAALVELLLKRAQNTHISSNSTFT